MARSDKFLKDSERAMVSFCFIAGTGDLIVVSSWLIFRHHRKRSKLNESN